MGMCCAAGTGELVAYIIGNMAPGVANGNGGEAELPKCIYASGCWVQSTCRRSSAWSANMCSSWPNRFTSSEFVETNFGGYKYK